LDPFRLASQKLLQPQTRQELITKNKDICPVRVYTLWPRTDSHP
jgi:hypothetical protein